jgi:CHAD domain-containing protein
MDNPQRPEYIRGLAIVLFDQTQPLHELDPMSRQVLELAAMMVNQSLKLGKKKPIKAVRKQIKTRFGEEISSEGQALLIPVIALQAGLLRRKDVIRMDLSPMQQRAVLTLAALLKIAIGLDASTTESTVIQQIEVRRGELWIEVDGPQVQMDIASAGHEARLWEKIGYPKINILELAEAQRIKASYPLPLEIVPVLPSDTLAEAGRKVMRQQFQMMLSQEEGTRLGENIEALHDMRVATRRLRASFEVFGDSFEPKALKPHLKRLRAAGRALGSVRDLDVFMEKAQRYLDGLPPDTPHGLDALLQGWQIQREQARAKMLAYLDSREYQILKDDFYIFVNTLGAGASPLPIGNPTPHRVSELVPALIYERLAAVRAYDSVIADAPVEQLHALRIEFKKLRYTVEYFRDVLGQESKEIINEFKGLQDHLGDLNDANVAIQILQEFLDEYSKKFKGDEQPPEGEIQAINAYIAFRQDERDRLKQSFPEAWTHFNRPEFMQALAMAISVL